MQAHKWRWMAHTDEGATNEVIARCVICGAGVKRKLFLGDTQETYNAMMQEECLDIYGGELQNHDI